MDDEVELPAPRNTVTLNLDCLTQVKEVPDVDSGK